MSRQQTNYDKVVGRNGGEIYILDYTFKHDDGFQGAVGTVVVGLTPEMENYMNSNQWLLERWYDVFSPDGKKTEQEVIDEIKTGSKVRIKYSGEHCSGWRWDMDETMEVDVVFFGTKHYIRQNGTFVGKQSIYNHYFTFHAYDDKTNKFVLFGSNHFDDCKNFVVEVIEY